MDDVITKIIMVLNIEIILFTAFVDSRTTLWNQPDLRTLLLRWICHRPTGLVSSSWVRISDRECTSSVRARICVTKAMALT